MPFELQAALISAFVALVTATIGGYFTWYQIQRERTKWLIDLKTSYSAELYKTRLISYPQIYQSLGPDGNLWFAETGRDRAHRHGKVSDWPARLLTRQKGVSHMVPPDDLTSAVDMFALVGGLGGVLWVLLTEPRERKRRGPGGLLALLLLWALLAGCASQPQAVPTSPSPSKPHAGQQWTAQGSTASQTLLGIAWSGSQFVAVGLAGTILTSPDGRTWARQSAPVQTDLSALAWSGSQFVTVGTHGTILTSPDGQSWTRQAAPTEEALYALAWSGAQFVVVGTHGLILTSPDGRTWAEQSAPTDAFLEGIAWSGSRFVAVGQSGAILTSRDGRTWFLQQFSSSPSEVTLSSIVWSGSQFVAVGDAGTILTSPDAGTWTRQSAPTRKTLYALTWSGAQFVAVGDAGTILTSP